MTSFGADNTESVRCRDFFREEKNPLVGADDWLLDDGVAVELTTGLNAVEIELENIEDLLC